MLKDKNIFKKRFLIKFLVIIVANLLCALAINIFFIPNKLLSGGIGGLGIMIQYLTGIPSGIIVFLINMPIFVFAFRKIDKEFAIFGLISMTFFSLFLTLTYDINQLIQVDDVMMGAIFGGVINGIGVGLLFRNKMCQDSLDIIATLILRSYNVKIGTSLLIVNTLIVSISSILFGLLPALYTIIAIFVNSMVLDKIRVGLSVRKNIVVMSNETDRIADEITSKFGIGLTFFHTKGYYERIDRKAIYLIVSSREVMKIKNTIKAIDPKAFLVINGITEVRGSGFGLLDD